MGHLDSGIRIFSPLADVAPFSETDADTHLTVLRKMRGKIVELVAAFNTLAGHVRTQENGLEQRFNSLYTTAAANVETFESELQQKFTEAKSEVDNRFTEKSAALDSQVNAFKADVAASETAHADAVSLAESQHAANVASDIATFKTQVNNTLAQVQTASTNAQNSASGADTSATNAATAAANAAASAQQAISVGDNYVAGLFNTVGSATRNAITGALAALGAWFGEDSAAPNAMILPTGLATFKSVQTGELVLGGVTMSNLLNNKPNGLVDYGIKETIVDNILSVETAVLELRTTAAMHRNFDALVRSFQMQSTVAGDVFTVSLRVAYDGNAVSTASTLIAQDNVTISAANTNTPFRGLSAKINAGTWSNDREIRLLVTVARSTGTGNGRVVAAITAPLIVELNDTGASKAPVTVGGVSKRTYTTEWLASAMYANATGASVELVGLGTGSGYGSDSAHVLFNNASINGETGITLNSLLSSIALSGIVEAQLYVYASGGKSDNFTVNSVTVVNDRATLPIRPSTAVAANATIAGTGTETAYTGFPAGKWLSVKDVMTLATRSFHLLKGGTNDGVKVVNTAANPIRLVITYTR